MTGMADTATFTAVDLSRLPAPQVIEALSYEQIYAQQLAVFRGLAPDFDATVPSDPVIKLIGVTAYREFLLRGTINDAARAVMVAYATDADLDALAALFGVARRMLDPGNPLLNIVPTYESDTEFRRRLVLAPEGYSVAGPEGAYIFHALSAAADVLDASATSPTPDDIKALVLGALADNGAPETLILAIKTIMDEATWPGSVLVTVLSRVGDGTASEELRAAVDAHVSDETVRPLTDFVTVQGAEILRYRIIAELTTFAGPDGSLVIDQARTRAAEYAERQHRLGLDITLSGLYAALHVEGVQNVNLIEPAAPIPVDRTQAAFCTEIQLTHAGVGE
jgi:phage-related baseplate assembly protein